MNFNVTVPLMDRLFGTLETADVGAASARYFIAGASFSASCLVQTFVDAFTLTK